jgi:O-antigen/teichoic acid export membrane protein
MLHQIKKLGAETAVYGIGTVAGRFLNFILVPFYTNVLLPAEYGIVAYLYSLIAFTNILYWYGMEAAYFKYASDAGPSDKSRVFNTPFLAMIGTSAIFSLVLCLARGTLAGGLGMRADQDVLITYTAGILFLDAIAVIPFALLRLAHRAKTFAWIRFFNILTNVLLNVLLLLHFDMGVEGIFLSALLASALTVLLLLPVILREFHIEFDGRLLRAMLKFSLPTVPAGLALMALQVIDRPILKSLTDDATVGIYQANYRLGVFMMILVSIYEYAWRPFYFSHAADPDAKKLFSRVMTYLVLVLSVMFMAFVFFVPDIAKFEIFGRHFIHPKYWSGLGIIPVVMLGYFFLGISANLSAGIFITKKTRYLPFINMGGAAVNIALNFMLIPAFGIMGAAWATFLAYFFMAVILYVTVQRIYPVKYESDRLWKIFDVGAVVLLIYYFLPISESLPGILIKVTLLAVFPVSLYFLRVFHPGEIGAIRSLFRIGPLRPPESPPGPGP